MSMLISWKGDVSNEDIRAVVCVTHDSRNYVIVGDRNGILYCANVAPDNALELLSAVSVCRRSVSSLCHIPPNPVCPDGAILVGSHDGSCMLWSLRDLLDPERRAKPICLLQKHDKEVCFVGATRNFEFGMTSGWDASARIFPLSDPTNVITLTHSNYAIWALAEVPGGFVTGGADRWLKRWSSDGRLTASLEDAHGAPIRDAKYVPECKALFTVANDGLLRQWSVYEDEIAPVRETIVSKSYLYVLDVLDAKKKRFAIGGDQGFVFIVENGKLVDAFPLPQPVWAISHLPNGDLVVGCANGCMCVLTICPDRRAGSDIEQLYFESLVAKKVSAEAYKSAQLASLPAFGTGPVRKLGVPVLMREGETKVLGVWVPGFDRWVRYGTLVSPAPPRPRDDRGVEWDGRVQVQIQSVGDAPLSLYFNRGEDELVIVLRFLLANHIPMRYLAPLAGKLRRDYGVTSCFQYSFNVEVPIDNTTIPADDLAVLSRWDNEPAAALALIKAKGRFVSVFHNMVLKDKVSEDDVSEVVGRWVDAKPFSGELVSLLADLFCSFPAAASGVVQQGGVVEDGVRDFDDMPAVWKAEFMRFLLNYVCCSVGADDRMLLLAQQLVLLGRKSVAAAGREPFLRACNVCAVFSEQGRNELKLHRAIFDELEGEAADGEKKIISELRCKLQ